MNLGETIYRLRTEKNMSQGDLADALGVSRQSVSKWENGNAVPDLEKLLKMSSLFGVTLDELVSNPAAKEGPSQESPQQNKPAPATPDYPTRKILGILLIVCGILCFFVPTFLGSILVGYLFGVPLAVVGSMLAFAQHEWLLRTCWLLYALFVPLLSLFGFNFIRIDISSRLSIILFLSLAMLILWTVKKARSGKLTRGSRKIIIACILLYFLGVIVFHLLFAAPPLETLNILHKNATSLL